ncbi:hypothetical protein HOE07_05310 [archaeon]|jgi:uncharacterized protein YgiM (DUF1202 family)|nr:hypothetical protein [archaeon]
MPIANLKQRKESRAFKKIVAKKTLQVRRKAFAEESVVQAKKKGKQLAVAKATKKGFGERLRKSTSKAGKIILKRALTPPKSSGKRKPTRTIPVERSPQKLSSPIGFEGF